MQEKPTAPPPLGIIFDTAMTRPAEAMALGVLYGMDGKNEARVLSVSVSSSNIKAAMFCDAVARYYGGFRPAPVGLSTAGKLTQDQPLFTAPLAKRDAQGQLVYRRNIEKMNDTADPVAAIRNA